MVQVMEKEILHSGLLNLILIEAFIQNDNIRFGANITILSHLPNFPTSYLLTSPEFPLNAKSFRK
jgi:hypothetical protein